MKVEIKEEQEEINWDKPSLVTGLNSDVIVMTVGGNQHTEIHFSGMVIDKRRSSHSQGYYTAQWIKDNFILFKGKVQLSND